MPGTNIGAYLSFSLRLRFLLLLQRHHQVHLVALLVESQMWHFQYRHVQLTCWLVHRFATPAQCLYGARMTQLFQPAMADPCGARSGASLQAEKCRVFLVAPSTARRCKS